MKHVSRHHSFFVACGILRQAAELGFSTETVKFLEINFKNNILFSSLVPASLLRSNHWLRFSSHYSTVYIYIHVISSSVYNIFCLGNH